jgi:hypothetical protein
VSATPNFSATQISSEALRYQLMMLSLIKDIRTTIPVKVVAVHPGTGNPPSIGTVDIQPLVQTVDGTGKLWNLGVTHNAQFSRIQSGNTAFILDPSEGDIGLASACDRDISSVIASGGQLSAPGSARTHDISDLVYLFTVISAAEITQYILANSSGITMKSPNNITINGVTIDPSGNITSPATIKAAADVIGGASQISLVNHTHTSASPGSPTSPPIP